MSTDTVIPAQAPTVAPRTLAFTARRRQSLLGILRLQVTSGEVLTPETLHQRFVQAVKDWVNEDPLGKVTWNACSEGGVGEVQIGDIALMRGFDDVHLKARLAQAGLAFVSFAIRQNNDEHEGIFDTILMETQPDA